MVALKTKRFNLADVQSDVLWRSRVRVITALINSFVDDVLSYACPLLQVAGVAGG